MMDGPTPLDEVVTAVRDALAPLGIRVTEDPAAVVPPCLSIEPVPEYTGLSGCGLVSTYEATLIPAATTARLAAVWLNEAIGPVLDKLPFPFLLPVRRAFYTVTEADVTGSIATNVITFQA